MRGANNITAFSNVGTLLGFEDGLDDNPTGAYDGSAEWGVANATLLTNRLIVAGLCTNPPFAGNILREYRTTCGDAFTRPTAPTGLTAQLVGDQLTLGWNAASDFQTSSSGLSYNLRVGTTSGGGEVISAMSDASGFRSVPRLGNAQKRTSWTVRVPIAGRYYWSVQAIDAGNLGGPFASEQQVAGLLGVDDGVVHGEALDLRFVSPVGAMVEFQLRLPTSSHVRFSIVDIGGREIAILANHELQAGAHEITWASEGLRAGVYFAALRAGRQTLVRRVVVLR